MTKQTEEKKLKITCQDKESGLNLELTGHTGTDAKGNTTDSLEATLKVSTIDDGRVVLHLKGRLNSTDRADRPKTFTTTMKTSKEADPVDVDIMLFYVNGSKGIKAFIFPLNASIMLADAARYKSNRQTIKHLVSLRNESRITMTGSIDEEQTNLPLVSNLSNAVNLREARKIQHNQGPVV